MELIPIATGSAGLLSGLVVDGYVGPFFGILGSKVGTLVKLGLPITTGSLGYVLGKKYSHKVMNLLGGIPLLGPVIGGSNKPLLAPVNNSLSTAVSAITTPLANLLHISPSVLNPISTTGVAGTAHNIVSNQLNSITAGLGGLGQIAHGDLIGGGASLGSAALQSSLNIATAPLQLLTSFI